MTSSKILLGCYHETHKAAYHGRHVGIPDVQDDGVSFEEKMKELTSTLKEQMSKEQELNEEIKKQLKKVGFEI